MGRRRVQLAVALVGLTAWSGAARAQPDDRRAAAQALFDQGKALVEAGRFSEACPKLAESMRLDPGIGTSLWLADCYENNGQLASAWAQFKEAAASAAMQKDPREKIARARADALDKKLPRLLIVLSDRAKADGAVVKRDGLDVGSAEIGVALPVNPGPHELTAHAPGRKTWTGHVTIPARPTTTTITIPPLEPEAGATTPALVPPPAVAPAPPAPPEEQTSTGSGQRLVGLVVAGVGVVGAGVGAYFAFDAKATYDRSNANGHCIDNACDADGKSLRSSADSKALVATIAIGAGAAAIIVGAVLYFTAPRSKRVGVGPGSLVVRF